MKASELKRTLGYVADDADVEFFVDIDGATTPVEPVKAVIETGASWPKRGELTSIPFFDESPGPLSIYLEKP